VGGFAKFNSEKHHKQIIIPPSIIHLSPLISSTSQHNIIISIIIGTHRKPWS
jgi:hypothetical protein